MTGKRFQPNPKKAYEDKSKPICFRLNPENPDEAEALSILQHWESNGEQRRTILTKALLALEGYDLTPKKGEAKVGRDIRSAVSKLNDLLERFRDVDFSGLTYRQDAENSLAGQPVDEDFLRNIASMVKPGLSGDDE